MKTMDFDLSLEQCKSTAQTLKFLAHPQRLRILCHLTQGSRTVGELEELCGISQSQVSQFLQKMRSERLVSAERDGKFVRYEIENPKILKLIQSLHKIFCP